MSVGVGDIAAADLSTVEEASNEDTEEQCARAGAGGGPESSFVQSVLAHPIAKLMLASLALLFIFIICGGGAASVQPWLHNASPSSAAYFSAGSVSIGVISCGSTLSGGMFSIGMISIGTFSVGIFSVGLFSIGFFSIGLASVGQYAIGMWAWGIVVAYSEQGQGLEFARRLPPPFGRAGEDEEAPENWLAAGDDAEAGLGGGRSAVEVSNAIAPARVDAGKSKRVIEVRDQKRSESMKDVKAADMGGVSKSLPPPDILLPPKAGR